MRGEPLFKVGDLLVEKRYPQGGTFVLVEVEWVNHPIDGGYRYRIVHEKGTLWVRNLFMYKLEKIG